MKKLIIGVFLALLGSINLLVVYTIVANNLTSSWSTPPGRVLTTLSEIGMTPILVIAYIMLGVGLIIMGIEYYKKT